MAHSENAFKEALAGKEIPLLTLDNKWHQLFTQAQTEIPAEVQRGEVKLNELIKRQGKLNTESKDIRKVKKKLMTEIMEMADLSGGNPDAATEKKMEDNRRLINECNERLEDYARELRLLPEEIAQINHKLMLITMDICYQKIAENTREIDKIEEWVKDIRIEMKKKLIRKAENEQEVFSLYSYMHDIFGAEVIEIFDLKYNPEERRRAQIERAQRKRAAAGKKEG
ncbi:MAG: hypothetical protein HFI01_01520 [Lachnospiraceae bacterium]|jgi:hypothetical protein|nr:hypothetical protein [Lachnospiraceae bacterium]MCI9107859.1 hypothetical protein [Lachnospiraceae bacterium]MCI9341661.1 hypothetical protein [Lachnospiraceae bacterium]GFH89408.1 hypothetical protein IMSAGC002_00653 [Lachnospiraceae bacterium]